MEGFAFILLELLITAVAYMGFPLIMLLIHHGKFEKDNAKWIALLNSIVVGAIFFILAAINEADGWTIGPAFLYYIINRAILTKKAKFIDTKPSKRRVIKEDTEAEEDQSSPSEKE